MAPEEKDSSKSPRIKAFDARNMKVPAKGNVNAGRVPKVPPKPTGSGGKGK